jgi:copper chaperone
MIEFELPDMTCGHCVGVVTRALQEADPACKVTIDLPAHRVRVETAAERDKLAVALMEAGYPPG